MLELFKIAGKIQLDGADKADKQLDKIDKKAGKSGSKLGKFAKKVGVAGAVVGGAMGAVGASAFAMVEKVTGSFDDISKGAQRVGVSTDFYQEMDFWASQNGLSHERMEKAVGRFNQRLGMAVNGNEKYSNALSAVGVNLDAVRDGTLSTEDAYAQTIQKLSTMESEQDKVNLATEIFGTRMARDMLPALADGALSIEDAKKKAQELGLVIGEDSLAAGVKFQDTWDQLKRSMTTASQQILGQMMPAFQGLLDWILQYMPQIQATIKFVFNAIGIVFNWFKSAINEIVDYLKNWFSSNEETMNGIWSTIKKVFDAVVAFLQDAWETIKQFWEENGQQILEASRNVFAFIQKVVETVMPIVQKVIKTAWDIIKTIFDTAIGVIMGLIKFFASLLTGDFEGMKDGLTKIWSALWDGIKGIVEGAWGLLKSAFSALWDSISGWFVDLKDDAIDWGKDLITGFWEGIKSMGSWIANKVSGFVSDKIPGPVKKVLKIASPSKLMEEYGRDTGEGLVLGIEDKKNKLQKTVAEMTNAIKQPTLNMAGSVGRTSQTSSVTNSNDNRVINVNVNPGNMAELQQVLDLFGGLKQAHRAE